MAIETHAINTASAVRIRARLAERLRASNSWLPFLLAAATSWMAAFPDATDFWIERGIGRRGN